MGGTTGEENGRKWVIEKTLNNKSIEYEQIGSDDYIVWRWWITDSEKNKEYPGEDRSKEWQIDVCVEVECDWIGAKENMLMR